MSDSSSAADCVFKDLCIDTNAPQLAASFWAATLGLSAEPKGDNYVLSDDVPEHTVWLNLVPEPKSVKNRVHLDVHAAAVAELVERGARTLADRQRWTVMADPEGAEFCAFVRAPDKLGAYRLYELVVDSVNPEPVARWWAERFGVQLGSEVDADGSFYWLEGAPGMPWEMIFGPVPESKTGKNRVHWDVWGKTETLIAAGATLLRARDDEISWDVLADPDGNEFCVFSRQD
jgi:hypothetical protein